MDAAPHAAAGLWRDVPGAHAALARTARSPLTRRAPQVRIQLYAGYAILFTMVLVAWLMAGTFTDETVAALFQVGNNMLNTIWNSVTVRAARSPPSCAALARASRLPARRS